MGKFSTENELVVKAGRTPTQGNWVSVEYDEFEIKLSDNSKIAISQQKLKNMCIECLDNLF